MSWCEFIDLKFCLFNVENLFLLFDRPVEKDWTKLDEIQWQKLASITYPNKPLKKTLDLAQVIQEIRPDILLLCEVGGLESLKNFNVLFLRDEYTTCLLEGNSDRNIDVGALIRKNLPFHIDIQSNKNFRLSLPPQIANKKDITPFFSRDVAELRLFAQDREKPFFQILLTHLKSTRDPNGLDPQGFHKRKAEIQGLVEIYSTLYSKHPQLPTLVAGDFNGRASRENTDPEFLPIYEQTDLEDVLNLPPPPTQENRSTFYQISPGGRVEARQIDFCFLNTEARKYLQPQSAKVYRYKDDFGFDLPSPRSITEKQGLPSDHFPLIFELSNLPL